MQPIANPIKNYSRKVERNKLQYEMRKLKGGIRGSKLFDARIYLVVRLATKAHLHPRC